MDVSREIKNLREFLKEYNKISHTDGYVIGISGGLDSSVLFKLIEGMEDTELIAMMLPINSSKIDEEHAILLTKNTKKSVLKVDLTSTYEELKKNLPKSSNIMSYHNIKPRLRMTALYQVAQANNLLVAGATNLSEYIMGYFTKHGDDGVDIMPLAEYNKREVYELGRALDLPMEILSKAPSAGLYEGQTDEAELGVSYDDIEKVLKGEELDESIYNRVKSMVDKTEHKRHMPIVYRRKGS